MLLAHYGGLVDAEFGPGTYGAIVAWQSSIGVPANGVVTPSQNARLDQMAAEAMSDLGMDLVQDLDGRFAIILPMGMLPERSRTPSGTIYRDIGGDFSVETFWRPTSAGDLASQYQQATSAGRDKIVSYSAFRGDLYVVTGLTSGDYFYELVHDAGNGSAGFRFTYDEEFRQVGGIASVYAASYSAPTEMLGSIDQSPNSAPPAAASTEAPTSTPKEKNQKASIPFLTPTPRKG